MKRFFYASMGILALAISFHLGASTVKASGSTQTVAAFGLYVYDQSSHVAVTPDGDLYTSNGAGEYPYVFQGNIFGGTTKTEDASWGEVKEMFR